MKSLERLRKEIDEINEKIIFFLKERVGITNEIAKIKEQNNLPISDPEREQAQNERVREIAISYDLNPMVIEKMFGLFINYSKSKMEKTIFNRIGIIGLGLMGGSIAKSIKARNSDIKISAYDEMVSEIDLALSMNVIDNKFVSIEGLARWSELIIVATPLSEVCSVAKKLSDLHLENSLIVLDISSVKRTILPILEELTTNRLEFVSTHPMAGREFSGFASSTETLFENNPWIITPHRKNKKETLQNVALWIEFLHAVSIHLNAEEHDEQVALISHLPYLISKFFLKFVVEKNADALKIAGTGFHSMTRLAKKPPVLTSEIVKNNSDRITSYWEKWLEFIDGVSI